MCSAADPGRNTHRVTGRQTAEEVTHILPKRKSTEGDSQRGGRGWATGVCVSVREREHAHPIIQNIYISDIKLTKGYINSLKT